MSAVSEEIGKMTEDTKYAADEALANGAGQLRKFFDDVEDLLRRVAPLKDEAITRARGRIESSIGSARRVTERGVKQAVDVTRSVAHSTDGYVHKSPWAAIGITAVACLALGSLIRRR